MVRIEAARVSGDLRNDVATRPIITPARRSSKSGNAGRIYLCPLPVVLNVVDVQPLTDYYGKCNTRGLQPVIGMWGYRNASDRSRISVVKDGGRLQTGGSAWHKE